MVVRDVERRVVPDQVREREVNKAVGMNAATGLKVASVLRL